MSLFERAGARSAGPRIGLALGSGAARGWAHIGVIEGLLELGIRPNVIAGSSIGALVGGAYAADKLDALKDFALSLDMFRMMNYFDLSFGKGGVIAGRSLSSWYGGLLDHPRFDDLAMPFAAVATDIKTGREIWLREGLVTDAVRASIAIPGIFEPVPRAGRWLADGGLVNPVPISVARAFEADVVIAVDLNADTFRPSPGSLRHPEPRPVPQDGSGWSWLDDLADHLPASMKRGTNRFIRALLDPKERSPQQLEVVNNAIAIMGDRITRARVAGEPPDIMITPTLADTGWLQFHDARETIAEGRRAVERMHGSIKEVFGIELEARAAERAAVREETGPGPNKRGTLGPM